MTTSGWILLGLRIVTVPLSIAWLGLNVGAYQRRSAFGAMALTALVALFVVEPFGLQAVEVRSLPEGGQAAAFGGSHLATVGGWLPVPFVVYEAHAALPGAPVGTDEVRVASWLWQPLKIASVEVSESCGDLPCWGPSSGPGPNGALLIERNGDYWIKLRARNYPFYGDRVWRLEFGVVSWFALAYWLVAGAFVAAMAGARWRTKRARHGVNST